MRGRRLVRRDNIRATSATWLLWDVTNVLAELAWRLPILWPAAYRALSRLDARMVAADAWRVDRG